MNIKNIAIFCIVLIVCMYIVTYEQYTNIGNKNIKMYGRNSCPYCVKMVKQLKNDGIMHKIQYIDVETNEGNIEFKKLKINGVPHFMNIENGKHTTGYMDTSELIKNLI